MEAGKHEFKATQVCQLGVVVRDLDKVVEDWSSKFGFGPWSFVEGPTMRIASVFVGPVQFELMQPVGEQPEQGPGKLFTDYLDKWGDGVHHVAFGVDDVDEEVSNLTAQGVKVIARAPGEWAYLESGGPGSTIFELMPRSSYELIREKGLAGFVEDRRRQREAEEPK